MTNRWSVLAIRSIAVLILFVASGVLISMLAPVTSSTQQESFMMGMMSAMNNSMMASMMGIALNDGFLNFMLAFLMLLLLAIIPLSIKIGLTLRREGGTANEKE
ncbi:hypothetical protein [Effusibacillus consociatus]|uniref:Uncharacterized protein n=1 Tax=Effusibacillus consociatus TaxID=1117041 RepID=A0ABV9PZJ0_9BACL